MSTTKDILEGRLERFKTEPNQENLLMLLEGIIKLSQYWKERAMKAEKGNMVKTAGAPGEIEEMLRTTHSINDILVAAGKSKQTLEWHGMNLYDIIAINSPGILKTMDFINNLQLAKNLKTAPEPAAGPKPYMVMMQLSKYKEKFEADSLKELILKIHRNSAEIQNWISKYRNPGEWNLYRHGVTASVGINIIEKIGGITFTYVAPNKKDAEELASFMSFMIITPANPGAIFKKAAEAMPSVRTLPFESGNHSIKTSVDGVDVIYSAPTLEALKQMVTAFEKSPLEKDKAKAELRLKMPPDDDTVNYELVYMDPVRKSTEQSLNGDKFYKEFSDGYVLDGRGQRYKLNEIKQVNLIYAQSKKVAYYNNPSSGSEKLWRPGFDVEIIDSRGSGNIKDFLDEITKGFKNQDPNGEKFNPIPESDFWKEVMNRPLFTSDRHIPGWGWSHTPDIIGLWKPKTEKEKLDSLVENNMAVRVGDKKHKIVFLEYTEEFPVYAITLLDGNLYTWKFEKQNVKSFGEKYVAYTEPNPNFFWVEPVNYTVRDGSYFWSADDFNIPIAFEDIKQNLSAPLYIKNKSSNPFHFVKKTDRIITPGVFAFKMPKVKDVKKPAVDKKIVTEFCDEPGTKANEDYYLRKEQENKEGVGLHNSAILAKVGAHMHSIVLILYVDDVPNQVITMYGGNYYFWVLYTDGVESFYRQSTLSHVQDPLEGVLFNDKVELWYSSATDIKGLFLKKEFAAILPLIFPKRLKIPNQEADVINPFEVYQVKYETIKG